VFDVKHVTVARRSENYEETFSKILIMTVEQSFNTREFRNAKLALALLFQTVNLIFLMTEPELYKCSYWIRHGWFLENCYIEPNIWRQKSLPVSVVRLCNVRSAMLSWKRFWRRFLWSDIRKACCLGNLAEQTEKKRDTSVRIARFVTWISTWSF
jgi:hypothetical protein